MTGERVVVSLNSVTKALAGGRVVLQDVTLGFLAGAKIGILGVNGAGKSTLLGILAGEDSDYTGERTLEGGTTIGYLPQEPALDENKNVEQVMLEGLAHKKALLDAFDAVTNSLGGEEIDEPTMTRLLEQQAELQEKIDAEDAWDLSREIAMASEALRCPEGDTSVKVLSGGEKRRVALCRLLLAKPSILLLDEPTNHLDAETVAWLERCLRESSSTVVLVTHDRYFLDNVTGWMLELDRGRALPHQGNYSSWLAARARRLAAEEREDKSLLRAIEEERAWMGKSRVARRERAKARIKSYEERLQAAEGFRPEVQRIAIPPGARLGTKTVVAEDVSKSFGDRLLFENLSFSLPQGGIVGVIGANGAGKTTLFRLIVGESTADRGAIVLGESVQLGYVDQSREDLSGEQTVWQEVSGGEDMILLGGREVSSRAYVASFNFRGSDQQKRVCDLSGGERNRLHLAKLLRGGGNVLLLDEPTNDLDLETLRGLELALEMFPGCAVIASHDRWFLDRLATHMLAFEGDGRVVWFEGDFGSYMEDKKRRLGAEALAPKRMRYKKIARD